MGSPVNHQANNNVEPAKHSPLSLIQSFCWFGIMYFLLLLRWGYSFGGGDQVEILPYALKLSNPQLYSNDFFITHIFNETFNQRWAISHLLSWFGENIDLAAFFLFSIGLFFLVRGIMLISKQFNLTTYASFGVAVTLLLLSMGFTPGGNELFSPYFIADSLSVPLCIFGILYSLKRQWIASGLLVGIASLFQPLMGFQVFILIAVSVLFLIKTWKSLIQLTASYVVFGGWVFMILAFAMFSGSDVSMHDYFDVYFRFRAPHHFIPSYFLSWKSVVFFALLIWAINRWYKLQSFVSLILFFIAIGAVVYSIGVEFFDAQILASTQWFKTMLWAKLIIGISLISLVNPFFEKVQQKALRSIVLIASIISFVGIVLLFKYPEKHPLKKQNSIVQAAPNEELYSFVKKQIPLDACFIIPIDNTDFKYGAQRSVFVDYKSVDPKAFFVARWSKRIELVYGPFSNNNRGFDFSESATNHYNALANQDIVQLRNQGVSHALFNQQVTSDELMLVYQDKTNFVYALNFKD